MAISPHTVKRLIEMHTGLPAPTLPDGTVSLGGWLLVSYVDQRPPGRARYLARPAVSTTVHADGPLRSLPESLQKTVDKEIHTKHDALIVAKAYAQAEGVPWSLKAIEPL